MSSAPARRQLAEVVQALVKTNAPTTEHYEAVCRALEAVASQDFGIPIKTRLQADFTETKTA